MLNENIRDMAAHLGEMAGAVPEAIWEKIGLIRDNLFDLADQVQQLEAHFVVPPAPWSTEGEGHEHP